MVISRSFPQTNPYWSRTFTLFYTLARSKNIPVIIVTSDREEANAWLNLNNLSLTEETSGGIPVFGCDATAVKTAARADPTFYLLKKGTILNKWSYASLELAIPFLAELAPQKTELYSQQ
jgi:hypothetical protein